MLQSSGCLRFVMSGPPFGGSTVEVAAKADCTVRDGGYCTIRKAVVVVNACTSACMFDPSLWEALTR